MAAYLRERDHRWRNRLTGWVGEHAESAPDRLLATFDAMGESIEGEDLHGCGFVNALAELPAAEHAGHAIVIEQKRWLLSYLTDLATATGLPAPQDLGKTPMLLHEGVAVSAATSCLADAARQARSAAALVPASP